MIIGVVGKKGGSGKTTTAIHVAGAMAMLGTGPVIDFSGVDSRRWPVRRRVAVVDGDPNRVTTMLDGVGDGFPFLVVTESGAAQARREADFVLIDSPGNVTDEELAEIAGVSDLLIVPTEPSMKSLIVLQRTVEQIEAQGKTCRALVVRVPRWPNQNGMEARKFLASRGIAEFRQQIPETVAFDEADAAGTLVMKYRRPAWRAYVDVARECLEILEEKT